jgi:AAA+ ATPase superfamily predicted ATPase
MDMDVVQREAPITEYPNPARNKLRYRIADPYLVFWHRFVADIRARGLATIRAPEELWAAYIEPRLDQYMGGVFEEASRAFVLRSRRPDLPIRPVQVGRWWTEDGQDEVDIVALGSGGEVLFGEAKWGTVSARDLDVLKRRGDRILPNLKGVRSVHYALFSGGGPPDEATLMRFEESDARHYSVEDLFDSRP